MELKKLPAIIGIMASLALLAILSLQYPLSVTFPIGPDAPAHIRDALKLTKEYPGDASGLKIIANSPYPVSVILFNTARLLPISWADRFTWWMTIGHIAVGLALGFFVYRIYGWQAAAIAIGIWAPLTTVFNNHIVSGTLPQLWSLVFLILFLERFASKSVYGTLVLFVITMFSHPLTAIVLLLSLLIVLPSFILNWKQSDTKDRKLTIVIISVVALFVCAMMYMYIFHGQINLFWSGPHIELSTLIKSEIAPWMLLLLPGWIIMQRALRDKSTLLILLNVLLLLTATLALNERFGVDIWTYRFRSTLIVMAIIPLSIGLTRLNQLIFKSSIPRAVLPSLLLLFIAALSFQHNADTYAYYEDTTKYRRVSTDEITAMKWLSTLPENASIISTSVNRNSEWIPLYSKKPWVELPSDNVLFELSGEDLKNHLVPSSATHLVFFLQREKVPANIRQNPDIFTEVYKNDGAVIFEIKK